MNGTDLLITLGGIAFILACFRQARCWRRQDEARLRHEENRRHWQVIERIERYGYQSSSVPDYIPGWMEEQAA